MRLATSRLQFFLVCLTSPHQFDNRAVDQANSCQGYAFSPLYPSVPVVALRDASLYELLALVDAICDGRARERNLAAKELESRLDAVTA